MPIRSFFIAQPTDSAATINEALDTGRNLILTPGIYQMRGLMITRHAPHTVVLGLGFPTLIPEHGVVSMRCLSERGVLLAGMIFDAGTTNSPMLLQVGIGHEP